MINKKDREPRRLNRKANANRQKLIAKEPPAMNTLPTSAQLRVCWLDATASARPAALSQCHFCASWRRISLVLIGANWCCLVLIDPNFYFPNLAGTLVPLSMARAPVRPRTSALSEVIECPDPQRPLERTRTIPYKPCPRTKLLNINNFRSYDFKSCELASGRISAGGKAVCDATFRRSWVIN